jgi:phage terminase large subunit-like protein
MTSRRSRPSRAAEIDAAYSAALPQIRARSKALEGPSLASRLSALRGPSREAILAALSPAELAALRWCWRFWARPKQIEPRVGGWRWWFQQGGRSSGKTRAATEWLREAIEAGDGPILLAGPTLGHVASHMLGGDGQKESSMLFDMFPPAARAGNRRINDHEIRFYNGVTGYIASGEDPEYKGPNLRRVWIDEPTKCRHLQKFFVHIEMTLRADGMTPTRGIITTNPPDPGNVEGLEWLKRLCARDDVFAVLSAMDENLANVDASLLRAVINAVGGTPMETRDRFGELGEDDDGALFFLRDIEDARVTRPPPLHEIGVCIDPAASDSDRADVVGIVAVADDADGELYALEDRSDKMDPTAYAREGVELYFEMRKLHPEARVFILAEESKFGKHVEAVVRGYLREKRGAVAAQAVEIETVTAREDKRTRARAPSVLYRRGRVHHVGELPELEREITGWREGKKSPGRMDALVHGINKLARLDEDKPPPDMEAIARLNEGLRRADAATRRDLY